MRGKRYETEKKIWGGDRKSVDFESSRVQSEPLNRKTYDMIAEEYSVSPSTIKRDAQFSQVVDILPEEAKHNVLSGKENITRSEAKAVIKMQKNKVCQMPTLFYQILKQVKVWAQNTEFINPRLRLMPKLGINQKIIQQQKLLQMNIQKRLVRIWQPNQKQVKFWGGDRGNQYTKEASRQNDDLAKPPKTRVLLADEYGVGTATH